MSPSKVAPSAVKAPSLRTQVFAVPLVTVAFLIVITVCVAMIWPLQRYQSAPGRAQEVMTRLQISGTDRQLYEPENGVRFVTALGTELTPLQAFMGWVDPYVDVLTCEERFGICEPEANKELQLGSMTSAKEIASYVALTYLGIEAELNEGPAQVGGFDPDLCPADAPARRACRVLEVGDVITAVDIGEGQVQIEVVSQLGEVLGKAQAGDIATLTVQSSTSEERRVEVELLASPNDPNRVLIGFNPRDTRTVSLPFTIDIDTDRIGGPSAGLSFVLALIDVLTPGELAPPGGVAATGTIAADGRIGPIGLLVQKVIAVKQTGIRYFLVPTAQGEAEIQRARDAGGSDVEIIAVSTLEEAVQAVATLSGVEPPSRANSPLEI
jgi:PDZ domain-containing protein